MAEPSPASVATVAADPDVSRALLELCADAALASYRAPATIETDDVHALIVDSPDLVVVALRGTNPARFIDLMLDAGAGMLRHDPILGPVPLSFAADAEQLFWRLLPLLPTAKPFALAGHSKGASEAQILAALLLHGMPSVPLPRPVYLAAFEPAPVGTLNGLLAGLPGKATRLGLDPIPMLPPGRAHAQPLQALAWQGAPLLDPLAYHSMGAVKAAL